MLSVVLIGTGNVARHLFDAFKACENIQISQVLGRNKKALEYFGKSSKTSSDLYNPLAADIYIIALSDDTVTVVSEKLKVKNSLIVHTSGSVGLPRLPNNNRAAVFYPLQTFSKDRKITFNSVPLCIEAASVSDLNMLHELANRLGNSVYNISTDQRRVLHLAAVFVNNFTNHMYTIAGELCEQHQLPFSILWPLIEETVNKIKQMAPLDAQTGPARRNDSGTIAHHKTLLKTEKQKEIYSVLSESILQTYGKKL